MPEHLCICMYFYIDVNYHLKWMFYGIEKMVYHLIHVQCHDDFNVNRVDFSDY